MKKLIVVFSFIALKSNAQSDSSRLRYFTAVDSNTKLVFTPGFVPTSVIIYGIDMTKGVVVQIKPNGDLFIDPKFVCECDTCKKAGLKFIRNIFKYE